MDKYTETFFKNKSYDLIIGELLNNQVYANSEQIQIASDALNLKILVY